MSGSQAFCLKLNSHQSHLIDSFQKLYTDQTMVDCTLSCSGGNLKAHKIVLSACSPYFAQLFSGFTNPYQYPVIILKDMPFSDLKAIVEFMYRGEVTVPQTTLPSVLDSAKNLMITGLCDIKIANSDGSTPKGEDEGHSTPKPASSGTGSNRRGGRKRRRAASDKGGGDSLDSGSDIDGASDGDASPGKGSKDGKEGDGDEAMESSEEAVEEQDESGSGLGLRSGQKMTPSAQMKAHLRATRIEKLQAATGGLSGRKMWSEEETRTLVRVWEEESGRVWASAGKKALSLQRISTLLQSESIDRDVSQVEGKIKALKRDYKAVKADRAIPAVQARMAPYLDKLDAVFSREDF